MLEKSIALATKSHEGQFRKGNVGGHRIPYIVHPVEVMKTAWAWGAGDATTLTAAVLHDTVEDTPLTHNELREMFGEAVARIVDELSFDSEGSQSKDGYMRQFATASISALVIKLADRYCNVRDFMLTEPKYAKKYFSKAAILVEIATSRLAEINSTFGAETGPSILAKYEHLRKALECP
jgi:(p)ppGpp synthase/HD superfamily hydrolase